MRILFECTEKSERVGKAQDGKDVKVYTYKFGKANEPNMKQFGSVALESLEPLHFKTGIKYDLDISTHSGIIPITGSLKSARSNN